MHRAIAALGRNQIDAAIEALESLAKDTGNSGLPVDAVDACIKGLRGDWSKMRNLFNSGGFIGENGAFLVVGRYTQRRCDRSVTRLFAIYGAVLPHQKTTRLEQTIIDNIGPVFEPIPNLLPVRIFARSGHASTRGEHLVLRYGWNDLYEIAGRGPTLVELAEHERQFDEWIPRTIRAIFTSASAEYILDPFKRGMNEARQLMEQEFNHAGQVAGWGFEKKLREGLIPTVHLLAVEKFRANGMALYIASRRMDEEDFATFIRAGWCRRFGIDSHRLEGPRDADTRAAMIEFHYLLKGGYLKTDTHGKLALNDPSRRGLRLAVEPMMAEAITLTSRELQSHDPTLLPLIYSSVTVPVGIDMLFEGAVRQSAPGKEFFSLTA